MPKCFASRVTEESLLPPITIGSSYLFQNSNAMASDETIDSIHGHYSGYDQDDDIDDDPPVASMSLLSLDSEGGGEDADVEPSSEDEVSKFAAVRSGGAGGGDLLLHGSGREDESSGLGIASMPGTPARGPDLGRSGWFKEYSSETEARGRGGRRRYRQRRERERWLEREWQRRKILAAEEDGSDAAAGECRVVVHPRSGSGRMLMDMEEVRACRDLGFGLPTAWTVEIPDTFSDLADTSSGGNSPINWRISSPGDDPRDVKAKLKVWAQAVALTSASRLRG